MAKFQQNQSAIPRVLFSVFCLTVIIAGGVFILDQGRSPYHAGAIPLAEPVTQTVLPAPPVPVPARVATASLTPAKALHQLGMDTETDLRDLIGGVLRAFDDTSSGRVLESYVVWAVKAGKSDAYVDSLLNSAAAKGHFEIPLALTTLSGRLDTQSLLKSVLLAATHDGPAPNTKVPQKHPLRLSDSLVGLSLAYYGDPRDHMRIADANGPINRMAEAQVGQIFEIPGL